jgi:16S rRNA (guanine(527)-N(7))-methyltransferase RsmG
MGTNNSGDRPLPQTVRELLIEAGCVLTEHIERTLCQHLALVQKWNDYASLVSEKDLSNLIETHLIDSLSLVPVIIRLKRTNGVLLDIGSGGGFPAIPVKIMLPRLRIVMVERSERKTAFLQKGIPALDLREAKVIHGSFPESLHTLQPDLITARAVEEPERLLASVLAILPENAFFFCQIPSQKLDVPPGFHVERVKDAWTECGLRRGELRLISRYGPG